MGILRKLMFFLVISLQNLRILFLTNCSFSFSMKELQYLYCLSTTRYLSCYYILLALIAVSSSFGFLYIMIE